MSEAIVRLRNVDKRYTRGKQSVEVLQGLTLDIPKGEFVALMGPSGSGKTTLLNLIGGLDTPSSGEITVSGQRLDQLGSGALARWRANHVGFVFQFYNLMPMLSAQRNVELPLLYRSGSAGERKKLALAALEKVGLSNRVKHFPAQLSGGQKQRVAIARAIAGNPAIILADEPTGNLDSAMGNEILEILVQLNRNEGTTIVMVTHDEHMARKTHRLVRLFDGSQVQ